MRFKRPEVRYSDTPAPVTPYQAAAQVWDERLGSSRAQARNWRLMAFGCLGLAMLMGGALIWRTSQSLVTPYVIEVEAAGQVRAVGVASTPYKPTDAQIAFHLARFITNVRSLSLDAVVVRQSWLEAYEFSTDRAAATLNEYARRNDPFSRVGMQTVAVEVTSVVRASDDTFQLRWIERSYLNGTLTTTERWTAMLSIVIQTPRTEERLRRNPLGIYVNGLNWSRELTTTEGRKP